MALIAYGEWAKRGFGSIWLQAQSSKRGIECIDPIYVMSVDPGGSMSRSRLLSAFLGLEMAFGLCHVGESAKWDFLAAAANNRI